jgi:hypothetical protein
MRRGCAVAVSVVLTGLVGLSASQDRTGSLSGVITDTTGRGLPGATITAVAEQGKLARQSLIRLVHIALMDYTVGTASRHG